MSSLMKSSGGAQTEPSRHGAIHVSKAVSGIVTNRFALSDPSSIVMERFYGGRQDVILSGSNIEILPRSTWARRYGTSLFSPSTFPSPVLGGYSYNSNGNFIVYVDTATTVYTITSGYELVDGHEVLLTSTSPIYTKSAGAGQSNYLQLGTTLFMTDGMDNVKFINGTAYNWGGVAPTAAPGVSIIEAANAPIPWTAYTTYTLMGLIVDSNSNAQFLTQIANPIGATYPETQIGLTGPGEPSWNVTLGGTTTEATGTPIVWRNLGAIKAWAPSTVYGDASYNGTPAAACAVWDTASNAVYVQIGGSGSGRTSGTVKPPFNAASGSTYQDNQCNWQFLGTASQLNAWKASHSYTSWYSSTTAANAAITPAILPPPSNATVYLEVPTNTGTSGLALGPKWSTVKGGQTRDGGVVWMNLGSAIWSAATPYTAWVPGNNTVFSAIDDSSGFFHVCVTSGTPGISAPTWATTYGATTQDGSVTWVCVGPATRLRYARCLSAPSLCIFGLPITVVLSEGE